MLQKKGHKPRQNIPIRKRQRTDEGGLGLKKTVVPDLEVYGFQNRGEDSSSKSFRHSGGWGPRSLWVVNHPRPSGGEAATLRTTGEGRCGKDRRPSHPAQDADSSNHVCRGRLIEGTCIFCTGVSRMFVPIFGGKICNFRAGSAEENSTHNKLWKSEKRVMTRLGPWGTQPGE